MEQKKIENTDLNSLNLYFKDISHESLITHEEEIELAKRIKQGDELAKEKLIKANLRFVITVAKQYQGRGLSLEDLIAEGNTGLIRAIDHFDETKGFHFISYAVWWIRQAITKAIYYTANDVRLPTSQIEPLNKINKVKKEFEQKYNRQPSLEEISNLTGFEEDYIKNVQLSSNKCVSIDTPMSHCDDEETTLGDCIPDNNSDNPFEIVNNTTIADGINNILNSLSNRDHDIICMVFGLNGCMEMSYEEISKKFALSSERIRQITKGLLKQFQTQYVNDFKRLL